MQLDLNEGESIPGVPEGTRLDGNGRTSSWDRVVFIHARFAGVLAFPRFACALGDLMILRPRL
jgi:hypothetical protein